MLSSVILLYSTLVLILLGVILAQPEKFNLVTLGRWFSVAVSLISVQAKLRYYASKLLVPARQSPPVWTGLKGVGYGREGLWYGRGWGLGDKAWGIVGVGVWEIRLGV